jgi:hypothetical protein
MRNLLSQIAIAVGELVFIGLGVAAMWYGFVFLVAGFEWFCREISMYGLNPH